MSRFEQAGQDVYQGGFTCAVGADDCDDFVFLELQIDFLQSAVGAIMAGDVTSFENHGHDGVSCLALSTVASSTPCWAFDLPDRRTSMPMMPLGNAITISISSTPMPNRQYCVIDINSFCSPMNRSEEQTSELQSLI